MLENVLFLQKLKYENKIYDLCNFLYKFTGHSMA